MSERRTPTTCPVCDGELITTRLGCGDCGTELVGEFARCSYYALDADDHALLRVFLTSRGNIRELEKFLGVSYPTARARFNDLLVKLGLAEADHEQADADHQPEGSASDPIPAEPTATGSVRDQVLAQVAAGTLSPDVAAELLGRLP